LPRGYGQPLTVMFVRKDKDALIRIQGVAIGIGDLTRARLGYGRYEKGFLPWLALENGFDFHQVRLGWVTVDVCLAMLLDWLSNSNKAGLVELVLGVLKMNPVNTSNRLRWFSAAGAGQYRNRNSRDGSAGQFPHTLKLRAVGWLIYEMGHLGCKRDSQGAS
jgi:hypothetical protein